MLAQVGLEIPQPLVKSPVTEAGVAGQRVSGGDLPQRDENLAGSFMLDDHRLNAARRRGLGALFHRLDLREHDLFLAPHVHEKLGRELEYEPMHFDEFSVHAAMPDQDFVGEKADGFQALARVGMVRIDDVTLQIGQWLLIPPTGRLRAGIADLPDQFGYGHPGREAGLGDGTVVMTAVIDLPPFHHGDGARELQRQLTNGFRVHVDGHGSFVLMLILRPARTNDHDFRHRTGPKAAFISLQEILMRRAVIVVFLLLFVSLSAAGDPVKFSGSVRLRAENWDWFETPGHDDSYLFFGSLIRVSAAQQRGHFDWQAEVAQPALFALPDRAIAPGDPGQLGFGGTYFAANGGDENAASIFVKQAAVRFKWANHSIRAGRFEFIDGTEVAPKNPVLAAVKSGRVSHRLLGNFGFSHVGRSFDGLQYVHSRPSINFTALAVRPTVGAFDLSGMEEIEDVSLLYGSVTHSAANSDARLFVIGYKDERAVVKTDNRPQAVRATDRGAVDILTIGGHYLAASGPFNLLAWAAFQSGEWGALDHSATALDFEAGYNVGGPMNTSIRGGVFRSSGDDSPGDGDHGTFFQILPTPRVYARFPFYNAMNSTDLFVAAAMKPTPRLSLASEIHRLRLSESSDLWYSGGGAFQEQTFGFAGRPSGGNSDLALVADLNVDYAFTPKTTFTLYFAAARGNDVIDAIYGGRSATMAYFEVLRRF